MASQKQQRVRIVVVSHGVTSGLPGATAELQVELLRSMPGVKVLAAPDGLDGIPDGDVDGVVVAVPTTDRWAVVRQAFDRQLPVLCEAPFAVSRGGAAPAATAGGRLMVDRHLLGHPLVRSWIEGTRPRLGELLGGKVTVTRHVGPPVDPARTDRFASGGGAGIDLLPQPLLVLAELLRGQVRLADASATPFPRQSPTGNEVERYLTGLFGAEQGDDQRRRAPLSFEADWTRPKHRCGAEQVVGIKLVVGEMGRPRPRRLPRLGLQLTPDALRGLRRLTLERFVACIRGETWPTGQLELALELQRIFHAVYLSTVNRGGVTRIGGAR